MAAPHPGLSTATQRASEQDAFLIEKTEEAIRDGIQLEQWCRRDSGRVFFPLQLNKTFRLPNRAEGFFEHVEINGRKTSVMGCRQWVELGPAAGSNPRETLREFVLGQFLSRSNWTYPDSEPGGFTVEQSLYKAMNGAHGKFPPELAGGCVDWRRLGTEFSWVLLTVHIHDFVMEFGPFRKRMKEAACVAPNRAFLHVEENPTSEYALEVSVGYPFVAFAPIPNFFGFGPGKFGTAVKLFSFFLTHSGEVRARMYFAAAPRCQKVFDFGPRVPDPVYGGAALLERVTFGAWSAQKFHNRVDTGMLAQHCRVHQALMDGVEKVWREWAGRGALATEAGA